MRKRISALILAIAALLCLTGFLGFRKSSSFSITFIDVGQGDSALVECDGQYMLIDGGPEYKDIKDNRVYNLLVDKGIQHLNILVMSHLHEDHIGGLGKVLTYATRIDKTIANSDDYTTDSFKKIQDQLEINKTEIEIPHTGDKYELGSAEIEVVDVSSEDDNDSLVLMVTYGKTRFLFTGDIEDDAQTRISDKYENKRDKAYKIDLIKMPHHGAGSRESYDGTGSLYRFIRTFQPKYAVISVGKDNRYGNPIKKTLDLLDDADVKVYRTDKDGDITVRSDGKHVSIETSK